MRRGPSLSAVVVTTDDNAAFLRECVAAVAGERRLVEVVVVVVGTEVATGQVVADVAAETWRVRTLTRPGLAVPDAWAVGARRATGRHLVLCEAGDLVDSTALGTLIDELVRGRAELAGGTRLELGRVGVCDVVVTRDLWRRARIELPRGPHSQWWAAAQLICAARRTVTGPALRPAARRGAGTAFGTMPVLAPWVGPWQRAVDQALTRLGAGPAQEAFLAWLLDTELPGYLEDAERCSPQEWTTLAATARSLLDKAPERVVAEVRVEARVRAWLAAESHRDVLERYNVARWLEEGQFATRVEGDQVHALLPLPEGLVPEEILELGAAETPLVAELRGMRWLDPGRLELEVFTFIRRVGQGGRDVGTSVWLIGPDGRRTPLAVTDHVDPDVNPVAGEAFTDHSDGARTVTVEALGQEAPVSPGDRWQVEVELRVSAIVRRDRLTGTRSAGTTSLDWPGPRDDLALRAVRAEDGRVDLEAAPAAEARPAAGWRVSEVRLDGGHLDVRGRAGPESQGRLELELRGPARSGAARVRVEVDGFHCRLALEHNPWGLGERPLPSGSYRVHLLRDGRDAGALGFVSTGASRWQRSVLHRMRPHRAADGSLSVTLAAPLQDDEVGPYAQQQLRDRYTTENRPLDPSAVFLQSYTGVTATDSPLAIHRALRRLRPDLRLVWAVADRSTELPEGAVPVLVRSRAWYDALATCGHVVTNVDMDRWFAKRPGQRLLQTFHGYPAKAMGIAAWQAEELHPAADRAPAPAHLRHLGPPAHPDPGDEPALPRAVPLRRGDPRSRLPARRRPGEC